VNQAPLQRLFAWFAATPTRTVAGLLLAACPVAAYAFLSLRLPQHLGLAFAAMGIGLAIARYRPDWRLAVGLLSIGTSARYIWWRGTQTLYWELNLDGATSFALFGAEIFGFVLLLAGYFQTAFTRPRPPVQLPEDGRPLPSVDIFVPTYNEDLEIVRRTLTGAVAIDYPNKKVWLLDEKRRPEMKALCEELGCCYMTRPDNRGAKAGNINHALAHTDGELVAVFDADQVPARSFLRVTVGYFLEDPRMALVQTPHHFYNPDPFERNLHLGDTVPAEQVMFYHVIQVGNDFWNSAFFCGSCALLRRSALLDVGGIAQETVTEDAHTALKMHARGWRSAYLAIPQAAGLATERYAFYVSQRIRWARGMVQILSLDNPLLKRGLDWAQRLNYFNAVCHFLFGVPRIVYLLAPPAWLLFGIHPLDASAVAIASYALPHVFLSIVGGSSIAQSARHSFWAEVFETAIAPYIAIITVLTLVSPGHAKFAVTAKGTQLDVVAYDWRHAAPNLVLGVLVAASIVATPLRFLQHGVDRGTLALAGFWNLYNGVILFAALLVALDRAQRRLHYRVRRQNRLVARPASPVEEPMAWHGRTVDLSEEGIRLRLLPSSGPPGTAVAPIPDDLELTLASDFRPPLVLRAQVLERHSVDGAVLIRARWVDPSHAQIRRVIEEMFSGANAWVFHAAPPDHPSSAALEVLRAPWRALRRRLPGRAGLGDATEGAS
jgi:cellulose synthase (UDP-forming)